MHFAAGSGRFARSGDYVVSRYRSLPSEFATCRPQKAEEETSRMHNRPA